MWLPKSQLIFCLAMIFALASGAAVAKEAEGSLSSLLSANGAQTNGDKKGWERVPASELRVQTTLEDCSFCLDLDDPKISADGRSVEIKMNNGTQSVAIIEEGELRNLFDELWRLDIPYQYVLDGCQARAHEMTKFMEQKGILPGKAFIRGNLKPLGVTYTQKDVRWNNFHVAPFVMVRRGGKLRPMILDPSLFRQAVDLNTWVKKSAGSDGNNVSHFLATAYTYSLGDTDYYRPNYFSEDDDERSLALLATYAAQLKKDKASVRWQGVAGPEHSIAEVIKAAGYAVVAD